MSKDNGLRLGSIGAGRMGFTLASRLLEAGHDVAVWNRTRATAEPLAEHGATIVAPPAALAARDVIFTMVGGDRDFQQVVIGDDAVLSREGGSPRVLVDSTTIS